MSVQLQNELLTVLRRNLRLINEENRDEDLTAQARELMQLLPRRIAIIEAAIENLNKLIKGTAGVDQ